MIHLIHRLSFAVHNSHFLDIYYLFEAKLSIKQKYDSFAKGSNGEIRLGCHFNDLNFNDIIILHNAVLSTVFALQRPTSIGGTWDESRNGELHVLTSSILQSQSPPKMKFDEYGNWSKI